MPSVTVQSAQPTDKPLQELGNYEFGVITARPSYSGWQVGEVVYRGHHGAYPVSIRSKSYCSDPDAYRFRPLAAGEVVTITI